MALLFLFMMCFSRQSATAAALIYPIVDTGVQDFTDDIKFISKPNPGQPYYGQDANYQGSQPSYKDNNDGTITDLVTGLMWQKVMDKKMTLSSANSAVKTFRLGNYNDWRIPTIKELYSLMLFTGQLGPSGSKKFIDDYFDQPYGNTSAGERDIDAQTLSATMYKGYVFGNTQCNFGVNFIDGRIKCYPRHMPFYFRFVRGNTNYGLNDFVSNGDGTVIDRATGLVWQQSDSGKGMEWKDALNYCESLVLAGRDDWRLPNAKELQSLVDYNRGPQSTGTAAISQLFSTTQIAVPSGATTATEFAFYWTGTTHKDGPQPNLAAYVAFGRAYGKSGSTILDVHGAGAQRSDPKSTRNQAYPQYFGPQGDLRTVLNYVRCVRNA